MYPDHIQPASDQRALDVHYPTPIQPVIAAPAPLVPVQPGTVPAVASIVLPDGRVVTGYAINPCSPNRSTPRRPSPGRP